MCKYCKETNTGNDYLLSADLRMNKIFIMGTQVFIKEIAGAPCLSLIIDNHEGLTISEKLISISYCPKCGRKLKE